MSDNINMGLDSPLTDVLTHLTAGAFVALSDYVTYRITNPKNKRIERKKSCLKAMEVLLDTNKAERINEAGIVDKDTSENPEMGTDEVHSEHRAVEIDSVEYAINVGQVKDFLMRTGIVELKLPIWARIGAGFKQLISTEKINFLSRTQKFVLAAILEFGYDALLVGTNYYANVFKTSPAAAIATNIYQIPTFFIGLLLGNQIKRIINIFLTGRDEKRLDKTINELIKKTGIVDIVIKYQPGADVQSQLDEHGIKYYSSKLTRVGKGIYKNLKIVAESITASTIDTADAIIHHGERREEKLHQEAEERKKRFDKLTEGR